MSRVSPLTVEYGNVIESSTHLDRHVVVMRFSAARRSVQEVAEEPNRQESSCEDVHIRSQHISAWRGKKGGVGGTYYYDTDVVSPTPYFAGLGSDRCEGVLGHCASLTAV